MAVLIIVLCFSPVLNSYAQSHDDPGTSVNYDRGKALYKKNCQFCHGARGDGNGPASGSMYPRPADFTDPNFWKTNNDDKIAGIIRNGLGMMPAFRLSPDGIKALIEYISHTFKRNR